MMRSPSRYTSAAINSPPRKSLTTNDVMSQDPAQGFPQTSGRLDRRYQAPTLPDCLFELNQRVHASATLVDRLGGAGLELGSLWPSVGFLRGA
jgi:hypothetical protein